MIPKAKSIKIFVIGPRGFPNVQGGIERYSESLYPRLVDLGYDVTSFAIKSYISHSEWKGVKFVYLPVPKIKSAEKFVYTFYATLYCIYKRPDIVNIHSITSGFFIFLLKLFGLKVVARYNSKDYLHSKWNGFGKAILRLSEKQFFLADYIITVSKNYLEYFQKLGRENRIKFIPNGVVVYNRSDYQNLSSNQKGCEIESNKFILCVGRITAEKNIELLIETFIKLKAQAYKLVIVGEGAHNDGYVDVLRERFSNSSNVIFIGKQNRDELNRLYANCKLFVMPSLYEGMPNVVLEAMSFNCNILLSDISAHMDLALEPDNYFKVNDPEDLKIKMEMKLSGNREANYSEIIKKHDWDAIAKEISDVFKEVSKV